jgi:hypothetical protein
MEFYIENHGRLTRKVFGVSDLLGLCPRRKRRSLALCLVRDSRLVGREINRQAAFGNLTMRRPCWAWNLSIENGGNMSKINCLCWSSRSTFRKCLS